MAVPSHPRCSREGAKFMSPTRNGVPLPYPTGIAPLNLHSRDGGLVLALTAIVIAAATQNGGIRTHQLLSATVEYQTDALFQRSLRPAEKGRPELAPQRGGESAAPRESPHSSIIARAGHVLGKSRVYLLKTGYTREIPGSASMPRAPYSQGPVLTLIHQP